MRLTDGKTDRQNVDSKVRSNEVTCAQSDYAYECNPVVKILATPMYLRFTITKGDAKHLSVMCIVLLQVHVVHSSDQLRTATCTS